MGFDLLDVFERNDGGVLMSWIMCWRLSIFRGAVEGWVGGSWLMVSF